MREPNQVLDSDGSSHNPPRHHPHYPQRMKNSHTLAALVVLPLSRCIQPHQVVGVPQVLGAFDIDIRNDSLRMVRVAFSGNDSCLDPSAAAGVCDDGSFKIPKKRESSGTSLIPVVADCVYPVDVCVRTSQGRKPEWTGELVYGCKSFPDRLGPTCRMESNGLHCEDVQPVPNKDIAAFHARISVSEWRGFIQPIESIQVISMSPIRKL